MKGRVEKQLNAYMGFVFEEICREYLWQENLAGRLPIEFTDMGRWWGNDKVIKRELPSPALMASYILSGNMLKCGFEDKEYLINKIYSYLKCF